MKFKDFILKRKQNNKKFQTLFFKKNNLSYQTYCNVNKGIISSKIIKKLFFATDGEVEPNDFFPLDEWKKELKESKTKKENYEES